jgi:hypothetical protein
MPKGKKKPLKEIVPMLRMDFDEAMRRVIRVKPEKPTVTKKRKK